MAKTTPALMTIGKLAAAAGVTPRTVRFYEGLGLLKSSAREDRAYRYYAQEQLARLKKIEVLKAIGLSLDEISSVLDIYFSDATGIRGKQKIVEILNQHLAETDQKLASLQTFRADLRENIHRISESIEEAKAARK